MFMNYRYPYQKLAKQLHWLICILVVAATVLPLVAAPQSAYAATSPAVQTNARNDLALASQSMAAAPLAAPFTYSNTTSGTITDSGCVNNILIRTFNVTDAFTINSLKVGLNLTHPYRGDLQATLQTPTGLRLQLINVLDDSRDNYDILLDSASSGVLHTSDNDDTAAPLYDRVVKPVDSLSMLVGENSQGTWTLEVCDAFSQDALNYSSSGIASKSVGFTHPALRFSPCMSRS